ncbi:hypothetical protein JCM33374_g639 [Metschnikowia sp. JCM 33374]|nr:hypothetical protein JCM33374_g639 [Metschnikowia sp. JCM 33374]
MSWKNTNEESYDKTDMYGTDHKSKLEKVGDKIKGTFDMDTVYDDSYESSGKNQDSFESSDQDFSSSGRTGDVYHSTGKPHGVGQGKSAYGVTTLDADNEIGSTRKGFGITGGGGDEYGSGYIDEA